MGLGGSTSTGTGGNIGTAGNGVFDGGSVPITEDQKKQITGQACAGFATEGETLPSVLELVVDVSSSMRDRAPGTTMSKWEVMRDALLEAIVGVDGPGLPPSIAVGLLFYPNIDYQVKTTPGDVSACVNTNAMVPINLLGAKGAAQRTLLKRAADRWQLSARASLRVLKVARTIADLERSAGVTTAHVAEALQLRCRERP